jgi:hypothetical protein
MSRPTDRRRSPRRRPPDAPSPVPLWWAAVFVAGICGPWLAFLIWIICQLLPFAGVGMGWGG